MTPSLFHLATHMPSEHYARSPLGQRQLVPVRASARQRNFLWRLVSPIRCLVACSGSNCPPTGSWWRVTAAKRAFGGKKVLKCLKFASRHLHQANSAKCPPSGTKCRKQSAYWNPLECNGTRQVAPVSFGVTWRHTAPNNSHSGG